MTSHAGSDPTEAQVEAAAKAIADNLFPNWTLFSRARASKDRGSLIHVAARAALVAAQGAARPVNSFDTTAERVKNGADSLHVATQEPLALDPEKVAEVIEQMRDRAHKERDVTKESLGQFISRALCEAYTEGKLS